MEGKPVDRKGQPLHTVEDYLAGKSDFVSLAGDYEAWPYGQKLLIPWGDKTLTGRVVDTGGHFHGIGKVYRDAGYEPIDVCVYSRNNAPPQTKVVVEIVEGDAFDTSRGIDYSKLVGQDSNETDAQETETIDQNKTTAFLVLCVVIGLVGALTI